MINFFDTLRIELGDAVGITIATPGWVESELTKGKVMSRHGDTQVDQESRDVSLEPSFSSFNDNYDLELTLETFSGSNWVNASRVCRELCKGYG